MAPVKRKTRKAIKKQVQKVISKHGPEFATAFAAGVPPQAGTLSKLLV